MDLTLEQIAAMAVAAAAEELGKDIKDVRIVSFKELNKSSLEKFIADNNIEYSKYQLGV